MVEDVLKVYEEDVDLNKPLMVMFEDEIGVDQGGVTKELFSLFWELVMAMFFRGRERFIPYISTAKRHTARTTFPVLGKIMAHMWVLLGFFPLQLAKSCVLAMSDPDLDIPSDILLEDYLSFIPEAEAILLQRCLQSSSWTESDKRRLIRFFELNQMTVMPSPDNVKEYLLNIAQTHLLDSCQTFVQLMKKGFISETSKVLLQSLNSGNVHRFYEQYGASPESVGQLVDDFYDGIDLRPLEAVVINHVSNAVREMNQRQVLRFLRWLTGTSAMPRKLDFSFNANSGITRAPVSHTCGNLLEISTQYETYEDFKREFYLVIDSEEAFEFTLI